MQDIESILDGKVEEVAADPTETVDAAAETEPKGEGKQAEEATASEQQTQPASETPTLEELMKTVEGLKSETEAFKATALAERKKRQEAEARNTKVDMPDVFENQEAFVKAIQDQLGSASFNAQANISEFMARREFPDLDEKIEKFKILQEADPTLATRVRNAVSPFHEIADIVTKADKLAKLDDVDKMEAEIRARIEGEIRAKIEAELAEKQKVASSIPQSLSDAASKGSLKSNAYAGPTPLDQLIN